MTCSTKKGATAYAGGSGSAPSWWRLPAALVLIGLTQAVLAEQAPSASAPTLTQIGAVHNLSSREAARSYPVHLQAVITYYDPYLNSSSQPFIIVTDSTGSIYVSTENAASLPLKPGVLVEVTGQSEPGFFAPDIAHGHIRVLGQSPLPPHPPLQSMTHLLTGSEDAQWVELEGVVKSFSEAGRNITLRLALADGEIAATTLREPGADYASLVDATVRVHGIAGSLFNLHRQITGLQLVFPSLATVFVERPAPEHPLQMPVTPIASLMNYEPGKVFPHRVHIHGTVTLFWPGRLLCLQDGSASLCAETTDTTPIMPGRRADVLGFPQIGTVTPTLSDAVYQSITDTHPVSAVPINAEQAFSGDRDAQLVQIEGKLLAHDLASQDPTIVVSSGDFTYSVALPKSGQQGPLLSLEEGSLIRMTGICSVQADSSVFTRRSGYPVPKYFKIMLRSPADVVVLQKPSWWTAKRTLRVLALALVITVCILCWVAYLRVRVKEQTALLSLQATHDDLTGVWNRKYTLDFLHRQVVSADSQQTIGVILIDVDHFKQVNDLYGHLVGDEVLKQIATRIQKIPRSSDLCGRYGGEEFLMIVSPCTGYQVTVFAEKIRAAIAEEAIPQDGMEFLITVSVGAALLDPRINTEIEALAAAANALNKAKNSGCNCVVCTDIQPKPKDAPAIRFQATMQ